MRVKKSETTKCIIGWQQPAMLHTQKGTLNCTQPLQIALELNSEPIVVIQ